MKIYDYQMSSTETDQWIENWITGKSMRAVIRAHAVEQATKRSAGKTRLLTIDGEVLEIISVENGVKVGVGIDESKEV